MDITNGVREDLKIFIEANLKDWKDYISDDPKDFEEGEIPYNTLTVGLNDKGSEWSYQTGDNSFTGGAYGSPHWAVVYFFKGTSALELFENLLIDISMIEVHEEGD